MSEVIRNVPAFLKSYLNSDNGKRVLNRVSYRDKKTGEYVNKSSAMAYAFNKAIQGINPDVAIVDEVDTNFAFIRNLFQPTPRSTFIDETGKRQSMPDFTKRKH